MGFGLRGCGLMLKTNLARHRKEKQSDGRVRCRASFGLKGEMAGGCNRPEAGIRFRCSSSPERAKLPALQSLSKAGS